MEILVSKLDTLNVYDREYQMNLLKNNDNTNAIIAAFDGFCPINIYADIDIIDQVCYIRHFIAYIVVNGFELRPYKNYKEKVFRFYLRNQFRHDNLQYFTYDVEEPQKVGKPTQAKMDKWVNYLVDEQEAKIAYSNERGSKVQDFLNTLKPYENDIHWHQKNKSGYIRKGNLLFSFEVLNTDYVNTKVTIDTQSDLTVDKFMLMADNEYQKIKDAEKALKK